MKTVTATMTVPKDGRLTLEMPGSLAGARVDVQVTLKEGAAAKKREWPAGFWNSVYGSVEDENFRRWPQGAIDPPPSFE